jgi:subtilase family serine protease
MRKHLSRLCAGALTGLAALAVVAASGGAANEHANYHAVCPGPENDSATCTADFATDDHGNPNVAGSPIGLSPTTIKGVYGFTTSPAAGSGRTIAIVDAYDDPTAEADLGVFAAQYGLPACTTANGCFRKVSQTGSSGYPRSNAGWALEIALDVEWAHAIAPGAKILLVEASSNSFANLLAAEDYASAHADYVSNSWGGQETSNETGYDSHFVPGKAFVSSGDNGTPAEYPSSSPNVISVGGTTLALKADGTLASETGWSGSGGGCSSYESASPGQSTGSVDCKGKRATPDVSLDADPASGVSVYDSTKYDGRAGWWQVGGTSASTPMVAARAAIAGVPVDAAYVYGPNATVRDITSGNNGAPAGAGYDLVTGRGSWIN